MTLRLILIPAVIALLTGCAHRLPQQKPIDPAEIQLTEAAISVSNSLRNLAEVQQAAHPNAKIKTPPNPGSYGMGRLASVDWSGPLAPLVKRLAAANGYQTRVMGVEPAIPVLVTVTAKNTPMGDILRDAGFQAGRRADIVVMPTVRTIEIRYAKA